MITILGTFLLFMLITAVIILPAIAYVFRKELKEAYEEYKNEQKSIS